MQGTKCKHWCFTINNHTKADGRLIDENLGRFTYLVCGSEVGDNGTPHIQGYVVFKNRVRKTAVKKIFPRAHLEAKSVHSTYQECIDYCTKDGDFTEHGIAPITTSERNKKKWDEAFALALAGKINDIDKGMLIRYYHAFKRIRQDNPPVPKDLKQKRNYWIIAPSQYGKSMYARKRWPDYYDKPPNRWFIGYKGQTTILCDDFGPKQCLYLGWYMKRWGDLYSFPMETKGGGTQIRPKHVVVTSQYTIEQCFLDELECTAIKNRYKLVNLPHWKRRINFTL